MSHEPKANGLSHYTKGMTMRLEQLLQASVDIADGTPDLTGRYFTLAVPCANEDESTMVRSRLFAACRQTGLGMELSEETTESGQVYVMVAALDRKTATRYAHKGSLLATTVRPSRTRTRLTES